MKVLVLAPHPFYQERGTPIAVDLLLKALCSRGDKVDLLTFHEGNDRSYPGLKIERIRPWFTISGIQPGFSIKKLICDMHMMIRFLYFMCSRKYDVVHAVEEAAFMAMFVCPLFKTPYIYDMDSSMTTQLVDKMSLLRHIEGVLRWFEGLPMRFAQVVIPMCDALAKEAHTRGAKCVVVLKDVSLIEHETKQELALNFRTELSANKIIVMYIGNLESYQGIDLLLDSISLIHEKLPELLVIIIGGADVHIEKYKVIAKKLGIDNVVQFLGKKPVAHMSAYMSQADLLVSPRTKGVNTPMKIYSYLHSKTAVLATDLPTHTQVMTEHIGVLAAPEKQLFAAAMLKIIRDDKHRYQLAENAYCYIEQEHSYEVFKQQLYKVYEQLEADKVKTC
ncbi:hypothetical protein MNBD_GAMMA16-666 [hydrothermal vent metagenome]|uniref:Glycosyl transferase family 1 domain-containing protein n=1 Tax=hydrothermal vent metagenome TaxID=652676 RepID=A0A3B0ZLM9_9ZZZZ